MRTSAAVMVATVLALGSVGPVYADESLPPHETPDFDITFPADWTVEEVQRAIEGNGGMIVLQAGPPGDPGTCEVADLGVANVALGELGVHDPWALHHAAADMLGRGGMSRSSGLGYADAWSSYMEGPLDSGDAFNLYSYLGREAWPGLEDAWLVLVCSSPGGARDLWVEIASSFAYRVPESVLASTGPVVLGGRAEAPAVGISLEVPADWMVVDLTAAEFESAISTFGTEGEWFALQLEHGVGDDIQRWEDDGGALVLWAWATDHGYDWPESCTVATGPQRFASVEELVDLGQSQVDAGPATEQTDQWSLVDLPAGEAARYDYDWTPTSGGVTYFFIRGDQQVEFRCSDQAFEDATDDQVKRDRWHVMAESLGLRADEGMEPSDRTVESSILDPGTEPRVDLVYEWPEGQAESATLEMWSATATTVGSYRAEEHPGIPFQVETTLTVEHVDADGGAVVETVVESVDLIEPPADVEAETLLADLQTLVGVRVRERLDQKGYLVASEVIDRFEDDETLHPTRDAARDALRDRTLRLPLESIGLGGTWQEISTTADEMGLSGTETFTKTVTEVDAERGVWLDSTSRVDIPSQLIPAPQPGLVAEATASGEGAVSGSWHVDLGRVVPAGAVSRSATLAMELPATSTGAVIGVELRQALALKPDDWSDSDWPLMPRLEVIDQPETTAAGDEADDPGPGSSETGSIDVVVLRPGAEPREELRYRLVEGQTEDSVVVMRMGMRTKVDGEWSPWVGLPAMELAGTSTITALRPDGSYDIEILYTDGRIPVGSAQLPPEALEAMETQMSSLVGMSQTVHMDDRGRILEAQTTLPPGAQAEVMQPGQLDAATRDLIDPLPLEPVGVGATWEVAKSSSDAMGFAAHGATTITLAGVESDGRLRLEGDVDLTADPGPMTIEGMEFLDATVDRFSTAGRFTKSVDLGSFNPEASSRAIVDYAYTVTFGETSEMTEMQTSMEIDAHLLPTSTE